MTDKHTEESRQMIKVGCLFGLIAVGIAIGITIVLLYFWPKDNPGSTAAILVFAGLAFFFSAGLAVWCLPPSEEAKEKAEKAKKEAKEAKGEAEKAKEEAEKAKKEAKEAKGEAEKAKEKAKEAKEEAEKAKEKAKEAKKEAEEAEEGIECP